MDHLSENNDTRKIENEFFLMRKIDEVKHEIFQLENSIFYEYEKCEERKFNCFRS
jgi:hypothetical protein